MNKLLPLCSLFFLLSSSACKQNSDAVKGDDKPKAQGQAQAPAEPAKAPAQEAAQQAAKSPALLDPAQANARAPDLFTVKLETTKGDILIDVHRDWAPIGADRFYNLVRTGYFNDLAFFRVISGFMVQTGISGDPKVNAVWHDAKIADDPVKGSNTRGMVSFATAGPNTRTTQFFINFGDNVRLDRMGFAPFAKVRDMSVVDKLYAGYGEGAPSGRGPRQDLLQDRGNQYLRSSFPELDYIKRASIVN